MDLLDRLDEVTADASARVAEVSTLAELDTLEASLLGKDSEIGTARRSMGQVDTDLRPVVGAKLQDVTSTVTSLLGSRRRELEVEEAGRRLQAERVDVTLPAFRYPTGVLHLIQQTIDEITDIFTSIGYQVADGPEAELAWYNFDALNTPPTHPARFESDTMYLEYGDPADEILLRTQTSPVQIRWMESHQPPVHVIVPGKTYRTDAIDATHLPVFHQIEGLAVDSDITFADLKGTLHYFAEQFFGPRTEIRLRPHFFPFTEPSAELDVSCFNCDGGEPDCRVCRGAGWLEMLGCGMVDPAVFEAAGYDPARVTGFAFGIGVERPAMVRHGITDIRNFIENDLRFLEQFT
ncbi:MAG TPA: phenylalanine--tRNA ligase subunit alpha [Acidimicrobiia bacterium]|nr:phenylalanine--tRNA ligase subunit alpha [Acidimicrobiia bacterium]